MVLLYTTWPDDQEAVTVARGLLDQRLIACANILPAHQALYRWEGAVRSDREHVVLFKTTTALLTTVRQKITFLHPYDEPCILALSVEELASAPGFLKWLENETLPPTGLYT